MREHVQEKGIICGQGIVIDFFFFIVWVNTPQLEKPFLR